MAKKKKAAAGAAKKSKTDAIRDALKESKDGSPTEVAAKLNKQGIKVTPQYVSTIKANDKRRAESGVPRRKPGRPAGSGKSQAVNGAGDLQQASELVLKAVELVMRAGAKEARNLISMAEGMVDKIDQK